MFVLHQQLEADCLPVTESALSSVLLMNNCYFPWLILVPRIPDLREMLDLSKADRAVLMEEIALASEALTQLFSPYKLNVAALGNQVAMLHVHVIARTQHDPAWPNPVWGGPRAVYDDPEPVLRPLRDFYAGRSA